MCKGLAIIAERVGDEWEVYAMRGEGSHDALLSCLRDDLRYGRAPHIKFELYYPNQLHDDIQQDMATNEKVYPKGWLEYRAGCWRAPLSAFYAVMKFINDHPSLLITFTPKMLQNADLRQANLSGANLRWADLSEANLRWADLSEANLSEANLSGANLSEANLSEANLSEANLSGANLRGANLSEANLSEANLSEANLRWADLSEANLSEANLSEANLRWADLSEANLSEANLRWADLSEAKNLDKAIGYQKVT